MAKQPEEFETLPSPGSSYGTSGKWKDKWKKIATENHELMAQYIKAADNSSSPWLKEALFKPQEVTNTFSQTLKNLSEQATSKEEFHEKRLVDVQDFLQSTLNHFQKKTINTPFNSRAKHDQKGEWDDHPFFHLLHQSYILNVRFLKDAASRIDGLDPLISRKLGLYTRHLADALSLTTHSSSNVANLEGALTSSSPKSKDTKKIKGARGPKKGFELGENLGLTPGKVVFQNDLFQLIQYEPKTTEVAQQPLLIVPPWINKYYIFDLSNENSFIKWAVESGLTVFIMSWINPDERQKNKTLTDYVLKGIKTALDEVCQITAEEKVNTLAYCSGGTLLMVLMAYLKAKKDTRIGSATFLATPFDFSKIDELGIYRYDRQQKKLEEYVATKGYLEGQYMVQAFNLLRTNDLIWSSDVNHYLLGNEPFPFDMLYWTCDALRMPVKMQSTYLRDVLIENQLIVRGGLSIEDTPLQLQQVSSPLFIVAAYEDHIAPWQSVYALTQITKSSAQKFILAGAGHLKGIFNPPELNKNHFWKGDSLSMEADSWLKGATYQAGSWWNEWRQWLVPFEGRKVSARLIHKKHIIEDAPGSYARM